eukprot:Gb_26625 [translate_table: standard]
MTSTSSPPTQVYTDMFQYYSFYSPRFNSLCRLLGFDPASYCEVFTPSCWYCWLVIAALVHASEVMPHDHLDMELGAEEFPLHSSLDISENAAAKKRYISCCYDFHFGGINKGHCIELGHLLRKPCAYTIVGYLKSYRLAWSLRFNHLVVCQYLHATTLHSTGNQTFLLWSLSEAVLEDVLSVSMTGYLTVVASMTPLSASSTSGPYVDLAMSVLSCSPLAVEMEEIVNEEIIIDSSDTVFKKGIDSTQESKCCPIVQPAVGVANDIEECAQVIESKLSFLKSFIDGSMLFLIHVLPLLVTYGRIFLMLYKIQSPLWVAGSALHHKPCHHNFLMPWDIVIPSEFKLQPPCRHWATDFQIATNFKDIS